MSTTTVKEATSDLDATALVHNYFSPEVQEKLQRLLEAVRADEREQCLARVKALSDESNHDDWDYGWEAAIASAEDAIR